MSGTTVDLRPVNSVPLAPVGWSYTGGPTTVHAATSDESDSTYATITASVSAVQEAFGAYAQPAGAQIRSVQLLTRMAGTGGNHILYARFAGGLLWNIQAAQKTIIGPGISGYGFKPATVAPNGQPWTAAILNTMMLTVEGNSGFKISRIAMRVIYNEQPVVSAVTPSGVAGSSQFTIGWTYTDPENDSQERWDARVFDDPLPAGFNPETSPARLKSGNAYVGKGQSTQWLLPYALPPGVYNIYVKASDAGSNGRYSQWASSVVTVAGTPPAPPILVSATADPTNGRVAVTVEQADNLLTQADFGGEEQTGGFLRWKAVSGISSGPTVVAGTGIGGSNGIQATVNAATLQARTPIGKLGFLVRPSQLYAWSGSIKNSAAAGTAHLDAEWYDSAGVVISVSTGSTVTLSTGFQASTNAGVTSPANAVNGLLRWVGAGLTSGQVLTWDENSIRREQPSVARGGLDSTNLLDPQDSTWASTSTTGITWAIVGTGTFSAVANAAAYDGFELQVAPGTVGGSHVLKLGKQIVLPIVGGRPNANYQFQSQGRAAVGSNLKASVFFDWLDDNDKLVATTFIGTATLVNTTYVSVGGTAAAPVGATKLQPRLLLFGEVATTDRFGFDSFGVIRTPDGWSFSQPWKPASQVDAYAIVEFSDDAGATWDSIRFTDSSLFDPVSRIAVLYDYEAPPNVARQYRAKTGAKDYQIDPVAGTLLSSAPSGAFSATLSVSDFYIIDPYTLTRLKLPHIGDLALSSEEPAAEFEPLGRPYTIVVSDVPKGERFTLSLAFNSRAEYQAFEAMRQTQHVLYIQTPSLDSWYVKLRGPRAATLKMGTILGVGGGKYVVDVPAVQVGRPPDV